MADINLVPEEQKKTAEYDKLRSKLMIASVAVLIITAIAAIATLSFYSFHISQRQQLVARIEEASSQVNKYKDAEELLVVAKDKVSTAIQIRDARVNKVDVYTKLAEIIPQNVYFSDIKIANAQTDLSGKARSSADVAGLVSALLSAEGSRIFSGVSINTLSADETGAYTFTLSASLTGVSTAIGQ